MNDALLFEIQTAYEGDLWPMRGKFLLGCFACPLTALAIHRGVVNKTDPRLELDEDDNPAFAWACHEFGEGWVEGFINGLEEQDEANDDSEYLAGYAFGEQALEQFFPREAPF